MRELVRPAILMVIILLVLILPFLAFGDRFEAWGDSLRETPPPAGTTALIVIGLLSTDIFLPVPSSVVSTLAGWQLGWLVGTLVSWLGMSVGAALGFWLARVWGRPIAMRLSSELELERMAQLSRRFGPSLLMITRGVPVFAEASVLLMGMNQLPWKRFLLPVGVTNLVISLGYSIFGDVSGQNEWLELAIAASIAIPVLLVTMFRFWFWRKG